MGRKVVKRGPERQYTPEEVIEALENSRGNKRGAARLLGCARQTIDNYFKAYPSLDVALAEIKEDVDDDLEAAFLEEAIDNRNTACLIRAVSTRLAHRGYGTVVNANLTGTLTIEVGLPGAMRQAPQPMAALPLPPQALNAAPPAAPDAVSADDGAITRPLTVAAPVSLNGALNGHSSNGHASQAGG